MSKKKHQALQKQNLQAQEQTINKYKLDWQKICLFEPAYLPTGVNGCRIYYDDGVIDEIPARINWVLDDWAAYLNTSIDILQKQTRNWLGEGNWRKMPLVLNRHFCLVPVRCRRPLRHNDGAVGYAVLQKIKLVQELRDNTAALHFHTIKQPIQIVDSRRCVTQNIALGWAMVHRYEQETALKESL